MTDDVYTRKGGYHWEKIEKDASYREHVNMICNLVKMFSPEAKLIIEVGCGDGVIAKQLNAIGIDISHKAVELAKQHGVKAVLGNATKLPFSDGAANVVVASELLEHLTMAEVDLFLNEVRRVLVKGGYLVISTPNLSHPYLWLTTKLGIRKCGGHVKEYSNGELKKLLRDYKFKVKLLVNSTDIDQSTKLWKIHDCISYVVAER